MTGNVTKETVKVCQINGASLLIAPWVRIILFPLQMNVTAVLKKQKKKLFWTRTDPFCTFKIISTNPALLSPCQSKRKHKDGHHRWTATVTKHKNVPIQRQPTLKATKGNAEHFRNFPLWPRWILVSVWVWYLTKTLDWISVEKKLKARIFLTNLL